jgi:hypothetical protein
MARAAGLSLAVEQQAVQRLFAAGAAILARTDAPVVGTVHGAGLFQLAALWAATSVTADSTGPTLGLFAFQLDEVKFE